MKEVCLDDKEYQSIHLNRCTPFTLYEYLRPCKRFEDGVFYGSLPSSKQGYQEIVVHNLYNLFQFSQIVEDEVDYIDKTPYLNSKFFIRRSEVVKEIENIDKKGNVVGFCLNGTSYHKEDEKELVRYFAENIYLPLVADKKEWKKLKELVSTGEVMFKSENKLLFSFALLLLKSS